MVICSSYPNLKAEMAKEKRKINAKTMVRHIRSGMSAIDLMESHSLTPGQLSEALRRLVEAGFITRMEQFRLVSLSESGVMQALETTTEILDRLQKSEGCNCTDPIDASDCVERGQEVEADEPTLRKLLESLRQSTQVIRLKGSGGEPSK